MKAPIFHCLRLNHKVAESSLKRDETEAQLEVVTQAHPTPFPELGIPQIPFDIFVKMSRKGICFFDAYHNLLYNSPALRCRPRPHLQYHPTHILFDPYANPLISLFRSHDAGQWRGLKGNGSGEELVLRVDQTLNTFDRIDSRVVVIGKDGEDIPLVMRGCYFWRSCTIYHHNSLVAQTNLMYTLGFRKHFVRRSKFRITIFPGFEDYNSIAALILIFLDGRS